MQSCRTVLEGSSRLANEQPTIKVRLDVDYPYPSRTKSFVYLALGIKRKKNIDYLKNSRIIARMINESPRPVMAYWFFTPYTIPDKRLLMLLPPERHEVGLHIVTSPLREWKILENETDRTVQYYTIHGTERTIGQLLWGRKIGQKQAKVPSDFPLKSFHEFKTFSLDVGLHEEGSTFIQQEAPKLIADGTVLEIHPEWLFNKGRINPRGPYYEVLKKILNVDHDLERLRTQKKLSVKIARDTQEYERDINASDVFLEKLADHSIDVFTLLERGWCCPIPKLPSGWLKTEDNVGLLEVKDFATWWNGVGKKTRNMVRKAEKDGVVVKVVEPTEKFAEGVCKIYNETPIRQERAFSHYGEKLDAVARNIANRAESSTFIGAYLQDELVGFIQLMRGERIVIIAQILSLQKHWDKALNNAMLAKAVDVCASGGDRWLMYGRIGNHPSLDKFKESNGFTKYPINRYYVPLSGKGKLALRLGLQYNLKDALPNSIKYPLIPMMNWVSRTKTKLRRR
jgi:hypothetical protein